MARAMASDIAINLEHVHAVFEHCINENIAINSISDGRVVFTHDWGDLGLIYGAWFAALLEIIAEEVEVIIPIDAGYMRKFPDQNEAQEVRQNCMTVLRTRSMPHNRAHWIMRQILQYCRWPQPPRTAHHNRYCFPTQEHINVMIASHHEFLAWAYQCNISVYDEDDDYDECRNFKCVENELFPHAFGTIEASFRNIDKYFRAQHYNSYYLIQELHLPRADGVPLQQAHMHERAMCQQLPKVLKQNKIPVREEMVLLFRMGDWWTVGCMRTFKKPSMVQHQKRIHDELRVGKFFFDHAAPWMCYKGVMHRDTVPHVMRYCSVTRPAPQ